MTGDSSTFQEFSDSLAVVKARGILIIFRLEHEGEIHEAEAIGLFEVVERRIEMD
ncbi:MAG TPA: hypothetical protein VMU13_02960 [Candidatus Paceibacterota bacterium]|nr:hypothetical protein [Candidatus Paceibacterota bacterium]